MIRTLKVCVVVSCLGITFVNAQEAGKYPKISINDNSGVQAARDFGATFNNGVVFVGSDQGTCTGVLIAPNIVLSARHCGGIWEQGGGEVRFGVDSNNPVFTASISSFSNSAGGNSDNDILDGGDFTILTLGANVPDSVATPYRIAEETSELVGSTVAMVGYGLNGLGSVGGTSSDGLRWGAMNTLGAYGAPAVFGGSPVYYSTDFDDGSAVNNTLGSAIPVDLEGSVAQGDSGGPLFVQLGDEWLVAGVLSGGTTAGGSVGDVSWWQGVQIFRNEIEAVGGEFVSAFTQDQFWVGGDGVWNAGNTNWTDADGGASVVFEEGGTAIFQGVAGTVTIDGTVRPANLRFNVNGYTLTGGTIDFGDANASVSVTNAGDVVTLGSAITGTGRLTLNGAGVVVNQGVIGLNTLVTSGELRVAANSLGGTIDLTNNATVTLLGDNTIGTYTSVGGTLDGGFTLTAGSYDLSGDTVVNANLGAGNFSVSSGEVTLNGMSASGAVNILDGRLTTAANVFASTAAITNTGTLNLSGNLRVGSYNGTGGNLSGNGTFTVDSFTGGTVTTTALADSSLSLAIDANGGTVTLGAGSRLDFSVVDPATIGTFSSYQLISNAGSIVGDATSIGFENFTAGNLPTGARGVFDVSSGALYVTSTGVDASGASGNTAAVANGILGGVFATGETFTNVERFSANAGVILARAEALAGADPADEVTMQSQLQELSPEVYGGVTEYGIQSHMSYLEKAMSSNNILLTGEFRLFAGINSFDIESDNSLDNANYKLNGTGGYFGVTRQYTSNTRLGVIGAADSGEISSGLLQLDGDGTMFGLFAESELNMPFDNGVRNGVFRASIGFSDYSFDGTRQAQGLINTVNGLESSILQAGFSYKAELFIHERSKISPFVSLNYIKSTTDAFTETGTINSLQVGETNRDSILLEYGFNGVWMPVSDKWGFTGMIKAQHTFGDTETELESNFNGASTPFSVVSPGLTSLDVELRAGMFFTLGKGKSLNFSASTNIGEDYESSTSANVHYELEW